MRLASIRNLLYTLGTAGFLFGSGSCINGDQIGGAVTDSIAAVIGAVFEQALFSFFQIA